MNIPIGVDDFKRLLVEGYTYVDKSLFIDEVIENPSIVQLITRPRRFGKTLNMSMLSYFFDNSGDNAALFEGLAIQDRPCFEQLGSHPVIFVSFKELKADDFETFLGLYARMMSRLYQQHVYLLEALPEAEQTRFNRIQMEESEKSQLMGAISDLMGWLEQSHGKKIVLLIDEYDSPIDESYNAGFYEPVIAFMRGTLGAALKGNLSLHKAVLTGILRISKKSIFSDLNNLRVYTVADSAFDNRFGFTEDEVIGLLEEAGRSDQLEEVRLWYNGYKVGKAVVYNPWSLLSFFEDPDNVCKPYWVNTSSNKLIHNLLTRADKGVQETLISLINGGTVESLLYSQTTLLNLSGKALWSLLLFSGYLTVETSLRKGSRIFYKLRIPNEEVRQLYQDIFLEWMDNQITESTVADLLDAFVAGDLDLFERYFKELVVKTMSFHDTGGKEPERVYHAFVLGLLANLDYRYHIRSNRESGYGRYDLMMIPKDTTERGVIMEFKVAEDEASLHDEANTALEQISAKSYGAELEAMGVTAYTQMGIAFNGKQVAIVGK